MTELSPYHEDQELDNNTSDNIHFRDILEQHISRRSLITKTASGAVALTLASTLTGCNDDDNNSSNNGGTPPTPVDPNKKPEKLNFSPVAKNLNDIVTVPDDYQLDVLIATGDSINPAYGTWDDNNIPSGPSFQFRSGDHHDGMSYYGLNTVTDRYDASSAGQGLLVINHEYINPTFLHPQGPTKVDGRRPEDETLREMNAHGVTVVEVNKNNSNQKVEIAKNSVFNRRITASTNIEIAGQAAGSALLATAYSPAARQTRGTLNNCGSSMTPWGTYLTSEENFIGYFQRSGTDKYQRTATEEIALKRYGLGLSIDYQYEKNPDGTPKKNEKGEIIYILDAQKNKIPNLDEQGRIQYLNTNSRYGWETSQGHVESQDLYDRWNADVKAANAGQDYRNAPNTFGWMLEIDPFDVRQNPIKRTSLGRFSHEDCRNSRLVEGENLAFYMGDDAKGEYIYKFVSDAKWDPKDATAGYRAGDKYLNSGKLYAAKMNNDGTGQWIELAFGKNGLNQSNSVYPFSSQADVVTFARLAADAVGATKMDRPEWCSVNPVNGEVYVTLTNNSDRGTKFPTDAANPRSYEDLKNNEKVQKGNVNGHIIRLRETADKAFSESFKWDIYLFGAEAAMASNINLSGLTDSNDFSSPDGMWFDPRGILWIQTDDGAYTDVTNCMMLAALPGQIGDGTTATTSNGQQTIVGAKVTDETLRRFLVGPKECEVTGIDFTPDFKAMFVNIQHPGEDSKSYAAPTSHWPATQTNPNNTTARPRSATVVITRKDGGVILG